MSTSTTSTATGGDGAAKLVSLREVCAMTSASRTWINALRASGRFPAAVPLGDKRIAFVRAEVESWIRARIAERDGQKAAA